MEELTSVAVLKISRTNVCITIQHEVNHEGTIFNIHCVARFVSSVVVEHYVLHILEGIPIFIV